MLLIVNMSKILNMECFFVFFFLFFFFKYDVLRLNILIS